MMPIDRTTGKEVIVIFLHVIFMTHLLSSNLVYHGVTKGRAANFADFFLHLNKSNFNLNLTQVQVV